jgi:hypothetical protein
MLFVASLNQARHSDDQREEESMHDLQCHNNFQLSGDYSF